MRNEEDAIRDLVAAWMRASESGDLNQLLSLMADDVVFLTPGNPPMHGRESFAIAFAGAMDLFRMEGVPEIQEVRVQGDLAYCWNHLTVTMTPRSGGTAMRRRGHALSIFRRGLDGRWLLFRDANLLGAAEPL